jgi:two-component system chemotaxis sensor kinase CheA
VSGDISPMDSPAADDSTPADDAALLAEFIDDYFAECDEHLMAVRTNLLTLERYVGQPRIDSGLLDALLRAFHSIKGLSGMVGVVEAERLAHDTESIYRLLREARVALTPDLLDVLTSATQTMEQVIGARRAKQAPPDIAPTLERLERVGNAPPAMPGGQSTPAKLGDEASERLAAALARGLLAWRFEFISSPQLAGRGVNVNSVRDRLQAVGELIQATPRITGDGRVAFEFLAAITPAASQDEATLARWREDGLVGTPDVPLLEEGGPVEEVAEAAPRQGGPTVVAPPNYVRVDLARLDDLMRHVSELVIGRARLEASVARLESHAPAAEWRAVQEAQQNVARQLRDLRAAAMRVRLVPIGEVFTRMQFAAQDVARAEHKQVRLVQSGQETEIDKLVVERMLDPLLHLVRNAVSHGLEPPAERVAAGKPAAGRLALSAGTSGDMVVIQVEDDGRGIDEAAVIARGRAAGLVGPTETLTPERLLDVLCAPGFSTRAEADLASGRGMGMAVACRAVRELGGSLALDAQPGRGTCFTIRLPLTLAILDALIVSAGGQTFAVPQLALREVIEAPVDALQVLPDGELLSYRGGVLPILRLTRLFDLPAAPAARVLYALVVGSGPQAVGLAVERLRGLREIVVGAVSDPLVQLPGIAGATELGDGHVVLILDPDALARQQNGLHAAAVRAHR